MTEGWNAIDGAVVLDEGGNPWLAWGSAHDGLFVQRLGPDGALQVGSAPVNIARRPRFDQVVEAANPVFHDGAWWLFASYDVCCSGVRSTYHVVVGRASSLTGPYVDRDGAPLLADRSARPPTGGLATTILTGYGDVIGPGHQYVFEDGGSWWIAHHWYDPSLDGAPRLGLRPLDWDVDGWPVVRGAPLPASPPTTTSTMSVTAPVGPQPPAGGATNAPAATPVAGTATYTG